MLVGVDGEVVCSGFCDASVSAYTTVVYLVIQTDSGNLVKFVMSNTWITPLQCQTIPILELLSALLLVRLMSSVADSLSSQMDLMQPRCFTDSQFTSFWTVRKNKEWRPFIQNRENEVCSLMPAECWGLLNQLSPLQEKSFETWKWPLDLFVDANGIWRCGGRLKNAELPYSAKHPALLSKWHYLTTLIVKDVHE